MAIKRSLVSIRTSLTVFIATILMKSYMYVSANDEFGGFEGARNFWRHETEEDSFVSSPSGFEPVNYR
jgi:hypothetical protein